MAYSLLKTRTHSRHRSDVDSRRNYRCSTLVLCLSLAHAARFVTASTWSQLGSTVYGEGDQTGEELFGDAVAISGNGARWAGATWGDAVGTAYNTGRVEIYELGGSNDWVQVGTDLGGTQAAQKFGFSISLNYVGNVLAVGCLTGSGIVRVYSETSGTWSQRGSDIVGSGGISVSLSDDGDRLAIGCRSCSRTRVYDFDVLSNSWNQVGDDINVAYRVSLTGNGEFLAIGAPETTILGVNNVGIAQVYQLNANSNWVQLGSDIFGEAIADYRYGHSIAVSANPLRLAVGSENHDESTITDTGLVAIYEYDWQSAAWSSSPVVFKGAANDRLGGSLAFGAFGARLVAGARGYDTYKGRLYIFAESSGSWTEDSRIDGIDSRENTGWAVGISDFGTRIVAGAWANSFVRYRAGAVRVFSDTSTYSPCDASAAPTNGQVNDCTSSLASGSTCQPTCDAGYTVSGPSSCTGGTLTAATCDATLCAENERVENNACIACQAGTTNVAGDDASGSDTSCDEEEEGISVVSLQDFDREKKSRLSESAVAGIASGAAGTFAFAILVFLCSRRNTKRRAARVQQIIASQGGLLHGASAQQIIALQGGLLHDARGRK